MVSPQLRNHCQQGTVEGTLRSKGFCHRRAFFAFQNAFAIEGLLPSKGLCVQSALALEGPFSILSFAFVIEVPLPHRRAIAIEGPLPSKCPVPFPSKSTLDILLCFKLLHRFNRCNSVRLRLSSNASSSKSEDVAAVKAME